MGKEVFAIGSEAAGSGSGARGFPAMGLDPTMVEHMPMPAALAIWPGPTVSRVSDGFPGRPGDDLAAALPDLDPALLEGVRASGLPQAAAGLEVDGIPWDATLIPVSHDGTDAVLVLLADGRRLARAEQAERHLDALMRHLPEGVMLADAPDVTVRRISDYGVALAQRPRDTLEGIGAEEHVRAWHAFHPDGTPAAVDDMPLTRATRYGEVVIDAELLIERPDGTRIPILCNAAPVRDDADAVVGGVVAWRDIGALKRAEDDLRASELRHRLALVAASMGDLEVDLETDLVERSALIDQLFGIEPGAGQLRSARLLERVQAEDRPLLDAALAAARDERRPIDVEFRLAPAGERAAWVALRGEVLDGPDGRPRRLVGVVTDVTRRKVQEQALARALEEKEAALTHSQELFGQVHHRVKNSLQLVASLLNLQGRMLGAAAETQFGEACRRVLTVAQVHERLYRTGRVSSVEFGGFLAGLCRDAERTAMVGGRDCAIEVEADRAELPTDKVVPLALVVNELIGNALNHAYPDGAAAHVRVGFKVLAGGACRLSVADAGVGLPDAFEPTRSRSLGMKLVSALARQIEGKLTVERLAPGTLFAIEF
jgi:two-component sensor histidine kinase/PAS domain-containing protein